MNPSIKVSVITVVYNGGDHLEQAMMSVLEQTYKNIEYVVIDGGSTDNSTGIIQKYELRLARWISEPDRGMYDAINKGLSFCTGELIGILNSDDWYEPDAVEQVVKAYTEHPGSQVYHGLLARTNAAGERISVGGNPADFLDKGMIEHPATFVTAGAYRTYGVFDDRLQSAADYELLLRFRARGAKFLFIRQVLANFRPGGQSSSFKAAAETLAVRARYKLISPAKRWQLLIYWRLKTAW